MAIRRQRAPSLANSLQIHCIGVRRLCFYPLRRCHKNARAGNFLARENISNFVKACKDLGVPEVSQVMAHQPSTRR